MFGPFLVVNPMLLVLYSGSCVAESASLTLGHIAGWRRAVGARLPRYGMVGIGNALLGAGAAVMLLGWQMSANDSSEPDLQAASRLMQVHDAHRFALGPAVEFIYPRDVSTRA